MMIHVTRETGQVVVIADAQRIEYHRICPCCDRPFVTLDPRQLYVKPSHSVRMSEMKRIIRESRRA